MMIPLARVRDLKYGKILKFELLNLILAKGKDFIARPIECPHLGFDLSYAKVQNNSFVCPYHNRCFSGNSNNLRVIKGVVFLVDNEEENLLTHPRLGNHWHKFFIKTNYKNLLANLVDAEHFAALHSSSGGFGLSSKFNIKSISDDTIECSWDSKWKRSKSSLVTLRNFTVISRVPALGSYLTAVNLVVPLTENTSILLVNSFFEDDVSNPIIDLFKNLIVYLLAWQDKWVLERVLNSSPKLEKETNPLILKIYDKSF